MTPKSECSNGLRTLLILLIAIGVVFRFVNLNHKVYWHDEAYTSLRSAGYTRAEIDRALFQNHLIPVKELQRFQQIKPGSTAADTVRSLAVEDPQHPPLYFLLTRVWMQALDPVLSHLFGSSLTTMRSLPALLSVLSLPLMYALARELFASASIALMATALLAISPFDVLFAQTARQYSLLTLLVIASQWLLLRAIRDRHKRPLREWSLYLLSVTLGLYTQPFFALTIAAQAIYTGGEAFARLRLAQLLGGFSLSILTALTLYLPWLLVILFNLKRALATTDWVRVFPGWEFMLKLWTLSFTSLFFDLDLGFDNPLTFLLRAPIVLLIGLSLYLLCRYRDRPVWRSVVLSIVVPFLLLAVPDLLAGGKRSAVSRYLISCFPGVQLAVAYALTIGVRGKFRRLWRGGLAVLVAGSLASLTVSAAAFTWWNRDLSYYNAEVAQQINAFPQPIVISDIGDYFTNTGDLLSLSYLLKPDIRLLPLQDASVVKTPEFKAQIAGATAIVFRPSRVLKQAIAETYQLQLLHAAGELWKLSPKI